MALVDDATLAVDEQVATYGWVNDMAHVPSKFDVGKLHYFMVKTPLSTYLGVPVYFAYAKVQAASTRPSRRPIKKGCLACSYPIRWR